MRRIVGITGYKESGKSTAAKFLISNHGYIRRPFAGPLKNMLAVLGLSLTHLDGELKEEPCDILLGVTPRRAMQTLGTEWGKDMIHPDLWVEQWRINVAKIATLVIADDLRFPNEAAALQKMGGIIVRVNRHGVVTSNHPSETSVDLIKPDRVITNDGSIEDLQTAIREAIH